MNREEKQDILSKEFGKYLSGWALSKAILEDYSQVISKIEGSKAEDVKNRIEAKAKEYFEKSKDSIPKLDENSL